MMMMMMILMFDMLLSSANYNLEWPQRDKTSHPITTHRIVGKTIAVGIQRLW